MIFEYKVVAFSLKKTNWSPIFTNPFSPAEVEKSLNELGQLGWELVSVDSVIGQSTSTREVIAYLKRTQLSS
jgi:hypothetical protein